MTRPSRIFEFFVIFLIFVTGSGSVSTDILEPIKDAEDEVALIFIPSSYFEGNQYIATAKAIQAESNLRIWIAITGEYALNIPDSYHVKQAIKNAIEKLEQAGMSSKNYIGVGHGKSVDPLLKNTDTGLKAMILMGGTLPQEKALKDFPVPVLTLAAELDGITRITRMAEEYEKLTDDKLWAFFLGLYETPVIYIDGASHGQFASGKMPPYITNGDLEPKETVDVVHTMIGQHVSDFLTANFGSDETEIDAALGDLSFAFFKSMKKFQPFLDVRDLETDEEESLWTVLAQEYFAGEYSDQVGIYNEVLGNPGFFMKEPSVSVTDGKAIVGTASLIDNVEKSNVIHVHSPRESPYEINMKLVSKESIAKALGKTDSSLKSEPNTCKTLNQLALVVALTLSDADAHERYLERGRPIIFEEDNVPWANFLWAPTPLEMWEEKDGLHVRSVAMVTHTSSWRNPGVHYCKVLPPYRAMEWVNVDSLRPFRG